jgi:hypothetical protein
MISNENQLNNQPDNELDDQPDNELNNQLDNELDDQPDNEHENQEPNSDIKTTDGQTQIPFGIEIVETPSIPNDSSISVVEAVADISNRTRRTEGFYDFDCPASFDWFTIFDLGENIASVVLVPVAPGTQVGLLFSFIAVEALKKYNVYCLDSSLFFDIGVDFIQTLIYTCFTVSSHGLSYGIFFMFFLIQISQPIYQTYKADAFAKEWIKICDYIIYAIGFICKRFFRMVSYFLCVYALLNGIYKCVVCCGYEDNRKKPGTCLYWWFYSRTPWSIDSEVRHAYSQILLPSLAFLNGITLIWAVTDPKELFQSMWFQIIQTMFIWISNGYFETIYNPQRIKALGIFLGVNIIEYSLTASHLQYSDENSSSFSDFPLVPLNQIYLDSTRRGRFLMPFYHGFLFAIFAGRGYPIYVELVMMKNVEFLYYVFSAAIIFEDLICFILCWVLLVRGVNGFTRAICGIGIFVIFYLSIYNIFTKLEITHYISKYVPFAERILFFYKPKASPRSQLNEKLLKDTKL